MKQRYLHLHRFGEREHQEHPSDYLTCDIKGNTKHAMESLKI